MWGSKYILGLVLSFLAEMGEQNTSTSSPASSSSSSSQTGQQQFDVIILSGQSNMAGRGGVHNKRHSDSDSPPPDSADSSVNTTTPTPSLVYKQWDGFVPHESWSVKGSILRLNADLVWEDASEPLHSDIDLGKVCGVGPGLTFAATVSDHGQQPGHTIGLVPCAKGATSITEWVRGSYLYERMINRTKAAVSGTGGVVKALLWYQGESDTLSEKLAGDYQSELEALIGNVRSDLALDELPFFQVGITAANHPHPDLLRRVREAQQKIRLPMVYYVDAQGLDLLEDNVHLTTASQVKLGKKLAESYMSNVVRQSG